MSAFSIVVGFNILKDLLVGLGEVIEGLVLDQFGFESGEKRFDESVVIVVIYSGHALPALILADESAKAQIHVLAAAIGMED